MGLVAYQNSDFCFFGTPYSASFFFTLTNNDGPRWGYMHLHAASGYTHYHIQLGRVFFDKQTETVFFPFQWSRACLALDSVSSKVSLVVDGQLLGELEYKKEEDENRPANLSLVVGSYKRRNEAEE